MDKGHRFLHNHPMTEKSLGLDEKHVIVDRDAWEEARKQVLNLGIPRVSIAERKLPVAAVIRRNAKLMDAEHFDAWYNEVTGN